MPYLLILGAALVAVTAFADAISLRAGMPRSILLVLLGLALAFVPMVPAVTIDPTLVLLLFLPPLLYSSGVGMSWRGFRVNLRPILLLAIGCVVFTATAVAAAMHWLLGLPWAVAFVLGAVVSPPDPVAPMGIARRLFVPSQLLVILEGEGLMNDATALILFSFAVAAVTDGNVSIGAATGSFLLIVAGEAVWGVAVAAAVLRLRRWAGDAQIEVMIALLTPYLAFWLPHLLGGSGVLATVSAGLYVSANGPRFIAPPTRLQGYFVWGLVSHLIEGVLFLLIGLQAETIVSRGLEGGWRSLAYTGALVSAVVIAMRFVWVFPATYLPRLIPAIRRRDGWPSWHYPFFIGFTGIRGVVSLAAALSIPLTAGGAAFPDRDLILFAAFCVILVTLVGQGSALPWLIGSLGLAEIGKAEASRDKAHEVQARVSGVGAALAELGIREQAGAAPAAVAALRRRHDDRLAEVAGTADETIEGNPAADDANLQVELIAAERRKIAELYRHGKLTDEARRRIERKLDLEDARNRHALESAVGDRLADPETA